jgi:uncharacterized protein YpbB
VAEVCASTGRAASTVEGWLAEWVVETGTIDVSAWVDDATRARVVESAAQQGTERLKPIFDALGDVPYGQIRLALAAAANRGHADRG